MPDPMKHQTTFDFWMWGEDNEYAGHGDFMTFKDDIVHTPPTQDETFISIATLMDFVEKMTGAH
jgi:hypothetical protein